MAKILGYHEISALPLKKGDVILIPKGTSYTSMHPQKKTGVTKRNQYITITWTNCGQTVSENEYEYGLARGYYPENAPQVPWSHSPDSPELARAVNNPTVAWTGSGGYHFHVDINDVWKKDTV